MIEKLRVPGLRDEQNDTLNMLLEGLDEKAPRNLMRSAYYDGKRAAAQVGSVIPPQYQNIALVLGWSAGGVDGLGRRCNLDRFVWNEGDLDDLGLPELVDSNFLYSELAQARTDSLIHGVSYLITTRGGFGEPKSLVHARDALSGYGDWNARTRRLDSFVSVTDRDEQSVTGFVLYLPDLTLTASKSGGAWSVDGSAHTHGVPVEPLVYKPRPSRRMGRSRITRPLMGMQDAALRSLMRLEAHMDIYAIPKMIVLGASDAIFKNANGTYKTAFEVAMGRVTGIPDDEDAPSGSDGRADVKQFAAESPEPHLKHINAMAKMAAREMNLPDADFALMDMANPTSADSYTASRENLIAEAEGATADWSVPTRRTIARALAIQNDEAGVPDKYRSIDTKWREPIYLSKAAQADAGAKQLGTGPEWLKDTRVGMELLGLDQQQIAEALSERQRNAGREVVALALAGRTRADAV